MISSRKKNAFVLLILFVGLSACSPESLVSIKGELEANILVVDFGRQEISTSQVEIVPLRSVGLRPVSINALSVDAEESPFKFSKKGFEVKPGQTHNLRIRFEPNQSGIFTQVLALENDSNNSPNISIHLSGEAYNPCSDADGDGFGDGCAAGPDCDDTNGRTYPGQIERCNNRDDNCDGNIDEGFALGEACNVAIANDSAGLCVLEGIMQCTFDEESSSCSLLPVEDVCDGVDNDCNGTADDTFWQLGQSCSIPLPDGCKQPGFYVCGPSAATTVCEADESQEPICPVVCVDEDGDGYGQDCEPGPDCNDNDAGINPGQIELCNNVDDNCNNRVDEDFQLGQSCDAVFTYDDGGSCTLQGITACSEDLTGTQCELAPAPEICDGVDNDCNGTIDDPFPSIGQECIINTPDGCTQAGVLTCSAAHDEAKCVPDASSEPDCPVLIVCIDNDGDGYGQDCDPGPDCNDNDADINPGQSEFCNGLDDNCDGATDENFYVGDACTATFEFSGNEPCLRTGTLACADDGRSASCNLDPAPELCDGVDNDCNGSIDETFVNLGESCNLTSAVNCLLPGTMVCNSDADDTLCQAEPGAAPVCPTVCVDEDGDGYGTDCDLGDDCDDSNPNINPGQTELCNARDDNCNNEVDEGFDVGDSCSATFNMAAGGTCMRDGIIQCTEDGSDALCGLLPVEEICDGEDNDCNGTIDDPFPEVGSTCSIPANNGCDQPGTYVCGEDRSDVVCHADLNMPVSCCPDGEVENEAGICCAPVPNQTCSYACDINLDTGESNCSQDVLIMQLFDKRGKVRVDMESYSSMELNFEVCDPSGYTLHVADSPTCNGWGGDGSTSSNDAEIHTHGTKLHGYESDYSTENKHFLNMEDYFAESGCSQRQLVITDQGLNGFEPCIQDSNDALLRINPMLDNEGTPDALWYLGLNRIFSSSSRKGNGLKSINICLY